MSSVSLGFLFLLVTKRLNLNFGNLSSYRDYCHQTAQAIAALISIGVRVWMVSLGSSRMRDLFTMRGNTALYPHVDNRWSRVYMQDIKVSTWKVYPHSWDR